MADDLIAHEIVWVGSKQYELSLRQHSMFVWLAEGQFDGKVLEGRGHSPRGAAQRWIEKALAEQSGQ